MGMKYEEREVRWLLAEKYHGVRSADFLRDCERLARGEPVDYVIGWTEFLGCRIDLSERPLIPRPETEWWVEKVAQSVKRKAAYMAEPSGCRQSNEHRGLRIMDMFAGSGCIGIAVLKHIPDARVDFVDIDSSCIRQVEKNCVLNGVDHRRYRVIRSDIFDGVENGKDAEGAQQIANNSRSYFIRNFPVYDVILANPPYVAEATTQKRVARSVRDHEPRGALFSGTDGLEHIRRFLKDAPLFLAPRGRIAMEFDDTQAQDVARLLEHSGLSGALYPDQYGRTRYLVASP